LGFCAGQLHLHRCRSEFDFAEPNERIDHDHVCNPNSDPGNNCDSIAYSDGNAADADSHTTTADADSNACATYADPNTSTADSNANSDSTTTDADSNACATDSNAGRTNSDTDV
jgi:hypothetical protein